MDKNVLFILDKKIQRTLENLSKNNMEAYFVKNKEDLIRKITELIRKDSIVSIGGSMTLFEMGVIDFLRTGKFKFLDRYQEGLTKEEIDNIYRKTFFADTFLTSTNAITENGELYNIDGNGNRVSAMIYGPKQVIVVAGINKIVNDMHEAKNRLKYLVAPSNAKRLKRNTPCASTGYCVECNSEDRICSDYVIMRKQTIKGRIKVIIIGEECGY